MSPSRLLPINVLALWRRQSRELSMTLLLPVSGSMTRAIGGMSWIYRQDLCRAMLPQLRSKVLQCHRQRCIIVASPNGVGNYCERGSWN